MYIFCIHNPKITHPKEHSPNELETCEENHKQNNSFSEKLLKLQVKRDLYSYKFLWLFCISAIRTSVPFYYSSNIKYLGIFYLKDDVFVTYSILYSLFVNFLSRVFFGNLVKKINFFNTCALLNSMSILCNLLIISVSFNDSRALFVVFITFETVCGSMAFNLNYVSCYEVFSKDRALHLLKVFDLEPILGMALNSVLNSCLARYARMRYLYFSFIALDLVAILGIKWYQRWLGDTKANK